MANEFLELVLRGYTGPGWVARGGFEEKKETFFLRSRSLSFLPLATHNIVLSSILTWPHYTTNCSTALDRRPLPDYCWNKIQSTLFKFLIKSCFLLLSSITLHSPSFMSGSQSPHSSLSTPTMHSTSPAMSNIHTTSDGGLAKYTSSSTSPSFASVVSSSAPAIPVSPSPFSSNSAPLGSTSAMLSRSQHQHQKHGPSAVLSSNYNIIKNSASLPAPSSVTSSTSQSNRSPTHTSSSDSALTSPASRSFSSNQSSNSSTGLDQSNSDSSDVEIYLDTLVLHGSVTRIHGMYLSYSAHHHTRPPLFFFQHSLSVSASRVWPRLSHNFVFAN